MNITSPIAIDHYEYYLNLVDQRKRERISRFYFQEDRRRSLYGDIMVRLLISERLKIDHSKIRFGFSEYGKPCLADYPDFHFNISHCGDWVICGIGCHEVGVDIEKIGKDLTYLADRYYTAEEYNDLLKLNGANQIIYFYDLWTLKESYLKCIGKGLNIPLNTFGFKISGEEVLLQPFDDTYNFKRFRSLTGYRLSVCSAGETISDHIRTFEI